MGFLPHPIAQQRSCQWLLMPILQGWQRVDWTRVLLQGRVLPGLAVGIATSLQLFCLCFLPSCVARFTLLLRRRGVWLAVASHAKGLLVIVSVISALCGRVQPCVCAAPAWSYVWERVYTLPDSRAASWYAGEA